MNKPNFVIGLGAGGHAKVIIEIVRMNNRYQLIGLLDPNPELKEQDVLGVPILGSDDCLPQLMSDGTA